MPIYEYACRKCGRLFEYMQRMSDPPKRKCEACGAQALERQISQTSFQLKGGGWYKDLYASPKPAATPGKGEGASEGGSSADSGSGSSADSGSASGGDGGSGSEAATGSKSADSASSKDSTKPAKKAKKKGSR